MNILQLRNNMLSIGIEQDVLRAKYIWTLL